MMKWEVMDNNEWLRLVEYDDELELRQVQISFTRKIKDAHFKAKYSKYKGWKGDVEFFQKKRFLPAGLVVELLDMGREHNVPLEIEGMDRIIDGTLKRADFEAWVAEFFKGGVGGNPDKMPRDYQVDAAFKICKFRHSCQELATNSGKTLITFMVVGFLMHTKRIKRFMMIVPNAQLVEQGVDDFQEYGAHRLGMMFRRVYGGEKDRSSDANVVLGTFQSLIKMDKEFLGSFDCVFCDEAHQAPTKSIKEIIGNCVLGGGGRYRFGLSGTLTAAGRETADFFTTQVAVGPMIGQVTAEFLITNKFATPIDVRIIRMNYLKQETRSQLVKLKQTRTDLEGADLYNLEKKLVIRSRERLNFVVDMILKTTKNAVVLFQSVEEGYGRQIFDLLRERSSDKEVYYVDGDVKGEQRDEYKARMEEGANRILVASFGTTSIGLNIRNIHTIFLVESYKSENIIKQVIGRMMRLHDDKERALLVDFVDDFSVGTSVNYLLAHMNERIRIYEQEKYTYNIFDVDLTKMYA